MWPLERHIMNREARRENLESNIFAIKEQGEKKPKMKEGK